MVRWYDYLIALAFANILLTIVFLPYIGFIAAYAAYELGWDSYCKFRLKQEYNKWR